MIAVIWQPSAADPTSGPIVQTMRGAQPTIEATAAALDGAFIEVDTYRIDYDATHHVVSGEMVEFP